jgi:class 3 adenylate cyclase/dihydrofolate reductase
LGRLIVTDFVTIDGIMEAPGLEEHQAGRNAWALRAMGDDAEDYNREQVMTTSAYVLGRKTYQIWAAFWPTATGDDAFTRKMNEVPKYVVSRTLERADWSNTTVIHGDIRTEIEKLKREIDGVIAVHGSADLVAELLRLELVDEMRLLIFPVMLGSGKRLFRDTAEVRHMRLVESRTFSTGVVLLTYQPTRQEPTSPYVEAFSWTQEQIRSLQAAQDTTRVLATVMFTDIVDSTARAAAIGDRSWRNLLDRHDQLARNEVERWHGQLVKTTGDGVLATFDAPTRALRCAVGLRDALDDLGLHIRAAIHTGEIEMRGGDVGGIGVHIAARALTIAGDKEVVVTRTVRDLATGTDLVFTPLGSVSLRGMPGEWELFQASTAELSAS